MSINMERVAELTEIESKRLNERTKGSGDMYNRARNSLSGGVRLLVPAARALAHLP